MSYYDDWDEPGVCVVCGDLTQCIEHDFCYDCFCDIKDIKYQLIDFSKKS